MKKIKSLFLIVIISVFLYLIISILLKNDKVQKNYFYPKKFANFVEMYSAKYGIDEDYVYAVIKTESDFNEKSESNVGARGLMQIMPTTFDWIKFRLSDKRDITYDDMLTAEYNIEYGAYMLYYLYDKYGSYELASAAYHAGVGTVDEWLSNGIVDRGNVIETVPSSVTKHYIKKVMKAFESYKNLYE